MRTDDLIAAIVADKTASGRPPSTRLLTALVAGGGAAAILFLLSLGPRPDLVDALQTWRFLAKLAVVMTAVAAALWACAELSRPDAGAARALAALAATPALLALATGIELAILPPDRWWGATVGSNSMLCLTSIPLLSIAPLAAALAAMRAGAPRSPAAAGAVAGLFAGGLGAALYAVHCIDNSPLFVALWYTPAIALLGLLGALAGSRMLRW